MPESKNRKLYPLFNQTSKLSAVGTIDNSNDGASDTDDDDDLPLTSLLMRSEAKQSLTRKSRSGPTKPKKGKKRGLSTRAVNTHEPETKNRFATFRKKQKQKTIPFERPSNQSGDRKSSASRTIIATAKVAPEIPAEGPDKSECNGNGRHDTETVVNNVCEDKDLSTRTSRNVSHDDSVIQRRIRRFYSDTAMDFVNPSQSNRKVRNVVHKLNKRITNGGFLSQDPYNHNFSTSSKAKIIQKKESPIALSYCWPNKWRIPSWISLEQPSMRNDGLGGSIDQMKWDPMGVLLAVAIERTIVIYDWDMLRAADLQGRSDRARKCQDSQFKVPSILRFRLPHPVKSLVWNPFEMDELAVGFRVSGETIIYNVNRVARWISKDPARNSRRLPPPSTYKRIFVQRVLGSVSDILFLDQQNVAISVGAILYRWNLSSCKNRAGRQKQASPTTGTLVWRYQPPSAATAMAPIGSNLIVIGTSLGHMCLVDWTKQTKVTLALSREHRPKILQTWIPHDRLKAPNEDKSLKDMMGIMNMRVETSNQECEVGKRHWGRCCVKWVTRCGWLLSMKLDSVRSRDSCLVHYSSPEVVFKNADGKLINVEKKSWSLPHSEVGMDLSKQVPACFAEVPAVTKILSHHDKFVLDSQPSTIVSKKMALVVHGRNDERHKIPFPGVMRNLPQALAVHPSLEWIVVGERHKLHVMLCSERCKINT